MFQFSDVKSEFVLFFKLGYKNDSFLCPYSFLNMSKRLSIDRHLRILLQSLCLVSSYPSSIKLEDLNS